MTTTVALLLLTGVVLFAYLLRRRSRLNWLRGTSSKSFALNLGLKSTDVAMGGVGLWSAVLGTISTRAQMILLSIGLLALALSTLQERE